MQSLPPIVVPPHEIDVKEVVDFAVRKNRITLIVVSLVAGGLGGWVMHWSLNSEGQALRLIAAVSTAVIITIAEYLVLPMWFRHYYRKPGHRPMFEERTALINTEGIQFIYTSGITSNIPWRSFRKSEWTKTMLVLYISDSQFVPIPRRLLKPNAEELVREMLGDSSKTNALAMPTTPV